MDWMGWQKDALGEHECLLRPGGKKTLCFCLVTFEMHQGIQVEKAVKYPGV